MFKLTDKLKAYAEEKLGVAKGAADADYYAAINKALAEGKLSGKEFAELTAEKAPTVQSIVADAVKAGIAEGLKAAAGAAAPAPAAPATAPAPAPTPAPEPMKTTSPNGATKGLNNGAHPQAVIGAGGVTVRAESEKYRKDRVVGKHVKTGDHVMHDGKPVEYMSQLELAKAGVWMRFRALRQGISCRPLDDHEKGLLNEMFDEDQFYKDIGGDEHEIVNFKGKGGVKAMLDDSTSGGQELVPIWFDDMIITFPLLHSEILPYVEIRDVPRSSRVEAASIGNPTLSWGSSEGTAFSLFNTASLAAAIDTTIFPVVIGVEQGLDWLSDTPVNAGGIIQQNIGEAALKEIDNVIVNGNGTNRPQGIANASGGTTVNSISGAGGPLRVEDAENLIFGLGKQYRTPAFMPVFVMNDTMYKRFRAIPVSGVDERRVFGMDHQSYQLLQHAVRIQNDLANGKIYFTALKRYRLYRRRGFDLRLVTEGQTLALKNTMLIVGRGRFGGKIMDGGALAKMTDAQL